MHLLLSSDYYSQHQLEERERNQTPKLMDSILSVGDEVLLVKAEVV
jgi:hypothetical protein